MLPITSCPLPHQIIKKKTPKDSGCFYSKCLGVGEKQNRLAVFMPFMNILIPTSTQNIYTGSHGLTVFSFVLFVCLFVFFLSRYSRNCWKFQCTRILWNGQERGCIPKIIFLERFIMFNFFFLFFFKKNNIYAVVYIKNCLSLSFYLIYNSAVFSVQSASLPENSKSQ